jgi:hypothetical protein
VLRYAHTCARVDGCTAELGFDYADLGVLTAIQNLIGKATEVV